MQTNRNRALETQLKMGNMNHWDRRGDWHMPGSKTCERLQPFSSVISNVAVLRVCICWRSTVHRVVSPAEKYHKTDAYPVGPFAPCETCFLFFSLHYMRFWPITQKTVHILAEKKVRRQALKRSWPKLTIHTFELRRLDGVFLRRHLDPSCMYIMSLL